MTCGFASFWQELKLFCDDCGKAVCRECALDTGCADHNIIYLQNALDQARTAGEQFLIQSQTNYLRCVRATRVLIVRRK